MNSQHLQTRVHLHSLPPPLIRYGSVRLLLPAQQFHSLKFSKNITTIRKNTLVLRLSNTSFNLRRNRGVIRSSVAKEEANQEQNQQLGVRRAYPFHEIEPKWQRFWEDNSTFRIPDELDTSKPKFYVLDMFPYPRFLSFFFFSQKLCLCKGKKC